MENYIKYALKPEAELRSLLEGVDNVFVVRCGKCFKPLGTESDDELGAFLRLVLSAGKSISGVEELDFLCNKTLTGKQLRSAIPAEAEAVFVISCGLGTRIQRLHP